MAFAKLTQLRQSLWDAVDNYAPLQQYLGSDGRRVRHEDDSPLLPIPYVPSAGDLPALEIVPPTADTPWYRNQTQMNSLAIRLNAWTVSTDVREAEFYWELLNASFWQAKPAGSSISYVHAVADPHSLVQSTTFTLIDVPEPEAIQCIQITMAIMLKVQWNPASPSYVPPTTWKD